MQCFSGLSCSQTLQDKAIKGNPASSVYGGLKDSASSVVSNLKSGSIMSGQGSRTHPAANLEWRTYSLILWTPSSAVKNSGVDDPVAQTCSKQFLGVTNPEVGKIYQACQKERSVARWYLVAVMPCGSWSPFGISLYLPSSRLALPEEEYHMKQEKLAKQGQYRRRHGSEELGELNQPSKRKLSNEARVRKCLRLTHCIPSCYRVSTRRGLTVTTGWAAGYEDGGPRVREGKFPVIFLERHLKVSSDGTCFELPDKHALLGWMEARNLRLRDFQHPASVDTKEITKAKDIATQFEAHV